MYIDPGSGSFIIQILIGAAAGAGLAIATFWRRIKAFFTRNKADAPTSSPATPEPTSEPTPGLVPDPTPDPTKDPE